MPAGERLLVRGVFPSKRGAPGVEWSGCEYCADAVLGDEVEEVVPFDLTRLSGHFGEVAKSRRRQ